MREIPQRRRVGVVDPGRLFQKPPGLLPLLRVHILQRKQLIGPDKLRVLADDLPKLHESHVLIALLQICQALVILSDRGVVLVKTHLGALQRPDIGGGQIALPVQVIADHPLHKRVDHLARLKVTQAQQVPRVSVLLVEFQGALQAGNRAGQISDLGLLKTLVVQKVRDPDDAPYKRKVRTADPAVFFCL